jgi:hypothetical protein
MLTVLIGLVVFLVAFLLFVGLIVHALSNKRMTTFERVAWTVVIVSIPFGVWLYAVEACKRMPN